MAARRSALVLSGGGIVGGAWMVGALHAIATETGWDPGSADVVIGTSAGSMIGAMLVTAMPAWLLRAYGSGEMVGAPGEGGAHPFGATFRIHWTFPRPVLASPELALRSLREPWKYGPAGILAWLPQGVVSTAPLKAAIRRFVPSGWAPHGTLWITAIDYDTGARVVFGRPGSPDADLADAVAASCAIPGFYHPVAIGSRRYIDGGMYSAANLDLAVGTDADVVVCINPVSSRERGGLFSATGPLAAIVRGDNRRLLDREAEMVRAAGKRVVLIEPRAADLHLMGLNYMSRKRLDRVVEAAVVTVSALLRHGEAAEALAGLPHGHEDRVRRPVTDPAEWPEELFPARPAAAGVRPRA
jgi:NTE family protein